MALETSIAPTEAEVLGRLINGFGILGSQLYHLRRPDFYRRAYTILKECQTSNEELLKQLDIIARNQKDESPLRLIEDLETARSDAIAYLSMAQRCLLVCAFLGHYIVKHMSLSVAAPQLVQQEKTLH